MATGRLRQILVDDCVLVFPKLKVRLKFQEPDHLSLEHLPSRILQDQLMQSLLDRVGMNMDGPFPGSLCGRVQIVVIPRNSLHFRFSKCLLQHLNYNDVFLCLG